MRKIKITVAVPEDGEPKVLYLGDDADAAIAAHNAAKGTVTGEVLYLKNINRSAIKRWKGKAEVAPKRGRPKKISED